MAYNYVSQRSAANSSINSPPLGSHTTSIDATDNKDDNEIDFNVNVAEEADVITEMPSFTNISSVVQDLSREELPRIEAIKLKIQSDEIQKPKLSRQKTNQSLQKIGVVGARLGSMLELPGLGSEESASQRNRSAGDNDNVSDDIVDKEDAEDSITIVDSVVAMDGITYDTEGDWAVSGEYHVFENLGHSSKKLRSQFVNKWVLLTEKTKYWFTRPKRGAFCCHNPKRKYYGAMNPCQFILTILILPICISLFIIFFTFWFVKLVILWIMIHCLCVRGETQLYTIDSCIYTKYSHYLDYFDFEFHRKCTYLPALAFSVPFKFIRYLTGGYKYVPLISNDLMYFILALGPMARELTVEFGDPKKDASYQIRRKGDSNIKHISLNLHPSTECPAPFATELSLFPGESLVVKGAGFDLEHEETYITVVDMDEKTHQTKDTKIFKPKPGDNDAEKERIWDIAKAHLQC